MKYKAKNGTVIEGTSEQVCLVVKALGENIDASQFVGGVPHGYYLSETKGLLYIPVMDVNHIRNALCKRMADLVKELNTLPVSTKGERRAFLDKFLDTATDQQISDLYRELGKR